MITGCAIIAVVWLVSMPLWVSIAGTILGIFLTELSCLVFTTRLFRFAKSQDAEEVTFEKSISESKIQNKGEILWKKQLQR